MKEKVLSIIIPTYNMENYISKCLDSLLIPSIDLLDILVINDGSKDKSSEIAHSYEKKYPGSIRVIDKENGHYGSCINRGLQEAMGKYIKILDADDTFATSNLEKFVKTIIPMNVDCIITEYNLVASNGNIINSRKPIKIKPYHIYNINNLPKKFLTSYQMHGLTYRTNLLLQNKYVQTEGIAFTDNEWTFLPLAWCKTFIFLPFIIYNYLIGREGQTIDPKLRTKTFPQSLILLQSLLDKYYNSFLNPIQDDILRRKVVKTIKTLYIRGLKGPQEMKEQLRDFDKSHRTIYEHKKIDPAKIFSISLLGLSPIKQWRSLNYPLKYTISNFWILWDKINKKIFK